MDNPFTDDFVKQEKNFYGLDNGFTFRKRSLLVKVSNDNAALFINKGPWASMAAAEIQSQFLPIYYATGNVATAGLGLGYFVLRAMAKGDVKSIDVYESNRMVIDFFNSTFKDRDGFNKVNIIKGDFRVTLKDQEYDFFYVDIYQTWHPEAMIDDLEYFSEKENIKHLYMWGEIEILISACYKYKLISEDEFNKDEREFLKMRDNNPGVWPLREYCEDFLEVLNRFDIKG